MLEQQEVVYSGASCLEGSLLEDRRLNVLGMSDKASICLRTDLA